ncbi:zinc finger CCCH domain-containing protein 12 isoform X2 [Mercurialis annua]|uniref:zinc finger CCCH domain-containing protein 12 isoform X2 n=1 Tax=Mercurialis annua TaxID=3986 RepID=UPI0021602F81|nr:zinc finger CCCH domain-containing protein 12 isoform X2 [Mercurialis annua]
MDYSRDNVVHVIPGTGPENWLPNFADSSAVWATEDDYQMWNNSDGANDTTPSNSGYQSRSGSEPPSKKSKGNSQETTSKKTIGKMFFKTKLCCKFRAGTCPYITNCNFAHSIEELRRPPPNWQEIVAAHEGDKESVMEIREEFQIPSIGGFSGESQRSYKGRHCKKFYTEEGCPYGDNCTFLHDEQSKNRESVAISLGPGGYGGAAAGGGGGGGGGSGNGGGGGGVGSVSSSAGNLKPSNWKTRICNKWELTGYCPFGNKCHFAHGAADTKQGVPSKTAADVVVASATSVPHSDVYHLGVPSQRPPSILIQRPGLRTHQKWKGPDKISRIYGDWIDDVE